MYHKYCLPYLKQSVYFLVVSFLTAKSESEGAVIECSSSTAVSFTVGSSCAFLGHLTVKVCKGCFDPKD